MLTKRGVKQGSYDKEPDLVKKKKSGLGALFSDWWLERGCNQWLLQEEIVFKNFNL